MNWFLNSFLTSWRNAVNRKFPKRTKASEGTVGDLRHQASYSEHNPDRDGSVDAWDMDVNVYGSSNPTGSPEELREIERLKKAFQRLPGSQLWIHNGWIANRDIDNWRPRRYKGANPHDKHVHWQSRSGAEKVAVSANVLDNVVTAINHPARLESTSAPKWPLGQNEALDVSDAGRYSPVVERAQRRLKERRWSIVIDGYYGPATARIVKAFQKEKGLKPDGKLGPKTWAALWLKPITG